MLKGHQDYEKGFPWFLAHDPRVPKDPRGRGEQLGSRKGRVGGLGLLWFSVIRPAWPQP